MKPEITIFIPTFERVNYLKRAIQSVLEQTYSNFSLHVLDNCSNDSTSELVHEFMRKDRRIVYTRHKKNIGPWNNFQFGLRSIESDYFSFLCDDDMLLPWFLEEAMQVFQKQEDIGFCSTGVLHVRSDKKFLQLMNQSKEGYHPSGNGALIFSKKIGPYLPGILFSSKVLEKYPEFDLETKGSFDIDYILKVSLQYPVYILEKPSAIFFSHSFSASNQDVLTFFWPSWNTILSNFHPNKNKNDKSTKQSKEIYSNILHFFKLNLTYYLRKKIEERDSDKVKKVAQILKGTHAISILQYRFYLLCSKRWDLFCIALLYKKVVGLKNFIYFNILSNTQTIRMKKYLQLIKEID